MHTHAQALFYLASSWSLVFLGVFPCQPRPTPKLPRPFVLRVHWPRAVGTDLQCFHAFRIGNKARSSANPSSYHLYYLHRYFGGRLAHPGLWFAHIECLPDSFVAVVISAFAHGSLNHHSNASNHFVKWTMRSQGVVTETSMK